MIRALATSGKTRSAIMPAVPTLDEAGVPGYEASLWTGLVAPADTPQRVIDVLSRDIKATVSRPKFAIRGKNSARIG